MTPNSNKLSAHLRYFFTAYLPQHRAVSPHTRLSYKDSFIQLLRYWKSRFPTCPDPTLDQFSVPLLLDFLTHLEKHLGNTASTRNTRLAALKSFFRMVALLEPRYQNLCRQILLIPANARPAGLSTASTNRRSIRSLLRSIPKRRTATAISVSSAPSTTLALGPRNCVRFAWPI